jgi:hypothetical protein
VARADALGRHKARKPELAASSASISAAKSRSPMRRACSARKRASTDRSSAAFAAGCGSDDEPAAPAAEGTPTPTQKSEPDRDSYGD